MTEALLSDPERVPRKVYVVQSATSPEDNAIVAIFSTREAAVGYIERHAKRIMQPNGTLTDWWREFTVDGPSYGVADWFLEEIGVDSEAPSL